jgi:hypothetical protein
MGNRDATQTEQRTRDGDSHCRLLLRKSSVGTLGGIQAKRNTAFDGAKGDNHNTKKRNGGNEAGVEGKAFLSL